MAKNDLAAARAALDQARAEVKEQDRVIGDLAVRSLQYGDPQLMGLVVVLNSQTPDDITNQLATVNNLTSRKQNTLDRLREAKDMLADQEVRVEQAKEKVAAQRKAAAANLQTQRTLEAAAKSAQAQVASLVTSRAGAQAAAAHAKATDKAELKKLKKENNRISQLLRDRAAKQSGGYHGNTGGYLTRPVPGYVTSPFGMRVHPIYGYYSLHDGTDFHAPCGTHLRAAAGGKVISEYYNSAWGNRLILDLGRVNGHGVAVIYNHLSRYRVGTGEHVKRGETVGYAGTTGWSTGCHLHFTVMVDGDPVNPMKWI